MEYNVPITESPHLNLATNVTNLWTNSDGGSGCGRTDYGPWPCEYGSHCCGERRNRSLHRDTRIFLNDSVETVDGIGSVRDHSARTVRLDQAVTSLNHVAATSFLLCFVVTFKFNRMYSLERLKGFVCLPPAIFYRESNMDRVYVPVRPSATL